MTASAVSVAFLSACQMLACQMLSSWMRQAGQDLCESLLDDDPGCVAAELRLRPGPGLGVDE